MNEFEMSANNDKQKSPSIEIPINAGSLILKSLEKKFEEEKDELESQDQPETRYKIEIIESLLLDGRANKNQLRQSLTRKEGEKFDPASFEDAYCEIEGDVINYEKK